MTTIQWFPGHMAKTRRKLEENLALVDAVIEIRDARIPRASMNPEIDKICGDKPRIILLNKSDLANSNITRAWSNELNNATTTVLEVNALNGKGMQTIKPALDALLKEKHDRLKRKGLVKMVTRAMVVGIPNVGKSTFINKMAKNNIAKTGDRPGLTKNTQWIKTKLDIDLLDTPGVLWPKFEDKSIGYNLAFTGAIKDEIMDTEELVYKLIEKLTLVAPNELKKRYDLDYISDNPIDNLDRIAKKRGCIMSGGRINYNRISAIFLDEFRGGVIGNISLEGPRDVIEEEQLDDVEKTEEQVTKEYKKAKKEKKKLKARIARDSRELQETQDAKKAKKDAKKTNFKEYQELKKAKDAAGEKKKKVTSKKPAAKGTKGIKDRREAKDKRR